MFNVIPFSTAYIYLCLELATWYWIPRRSCLQETDSPSVALHLEVESCLSCPVHIGMPVDVIILDQKGNKKDKIGKEKVKLSLFMDDMILYIKYLKNFTRKLLEMINTFI